MTAEEAIKRIKEFGLYHAINDLPYSIKTVEAFNMAIEALQEHKIGKWINCKYPLGECSKCHAIVDIQNNEANYCPVCGSKNRGDEE